MTFRSLILGAGLLAVALASGAQTAARKPYIVQLADAPAAVYTGTLSGLAATRPAPGVKFDAGLPSVRAYVNYLNVRQSTALARVGSPPLLHSYNLAFNGFAASLTDAEAKSLKTSIDVVSVTPSRMLRIVTTTSPTFLGLTAPGGLWSQLDAQSRQVKGEDVIIGMLDSGVWPEDPSFGDKQSASGKPVAYFQPGTPVYGAPPSKWKGICQTGPGFTAEMCNNKLIGARFHAEGFLAGHETLDPLEYASPRDGNGHGSHTSSTSGGNMGVDASINGIALGQISGMAPRARIATYKICWLATGATDVGCNNTDTLKAIDDALADGVDIISFSISGTLTDLADPVETGFLNAAAAGVFVSAAAGNEGPGDTVNHPGPWLTTVAASTQNRNPVATLTLANGTAFTGTSVNATPVAAKPIVLATTVALASSDPANANRCFLNSLDPVKAAGKIVVCDRGTNARVEKSAEVLRVGGVGMVLVNVSAAADDTVADFHSVPTVHLHLADRAAVRTYAATTGATASISASFNAPVVAPVMADFSSRGPNLADLNVLKPDISAPGVDIIAAYSDQTLTQAQHDALIAGTLRGSAVVNSISGTSMATPHVAGVAALLKQLHPTWTPAAIKSALMTSTSDIKLSTGALDPNRFAYGAGHLNPNPAGDPGLVYDATATDYYRYLCGANVTLPAGAGSCSSVGSTLPWDLNLASLTAGAVTAPLTLHRTVTNVGRGTATYVSTASLPGWTATVTPPSLTLAPGAKGTFSVDLAPGNAPAGSWSFGTLVWSDGVHQVRSPLSARALAFIAPTDESATLPAAMGSKVYTVVSGYTGRLTVVPTGMQPATLTAGNVGLNKTQCFDFVVPAGTQVARFQLFNADTAGAGVPNGTDLDLSVFDGPGGTGTQVGSSGSSTSDELVSVIAPSAGTYSACVAGFATPVSGFAAYKLSSWIVGAPVGAQTLRAAAPNQVFAGEAGTIGLRWNVQTGKRYLGTVQYVNPANNLTLGSTVLFVDAR